MALNDALVDWRNVMYKRWGLTIGQWEGARARHWDYVLETEFPGYLSLRK